MRTFNFETNIQERLPWNGKVYYVKRMTSDYAECFPFNLDQFIEDVYQKFAGTEFEENREVLRKVWNETLMMPVHGDKSLYPNAGGARRPAAIEVWHKAGDYWRRGLRIGDTLPQIVPPHTITRLPEGGWICLFPKEMHLLDEETTLQKDNNSELNVLENLDDLESDAKSDGQAVDVETTEAVAPADIAPDTDDTPDVTIQDQVQTDLQELNVQHNSSRIDRRRQRKQRKAQRITYEDQLERNAMNTEKAAREDEHRKVYAAIGAAAVTLVMIHFFGLLGPAVFGLLVGGLLKG